MTENPLEKLTLDTKLTVEDALAQLSQATGYSDETLSRWMPKLKNCGGVRLEAMPDRFSRSSDCTAIVWVLPDGVKGRYSIWFRPDSGPNVYDDTEE